MSGAIQQQPAPPTAPSPGMPGGPMPQMQPNPAFATWQQVNQQRQAIIAANAQKQAQFDAACALIRKDGIRGFRLDIEADSTVAPDAAADQAARTTFLKEIIPLLQQITPIAMGNPSMAKLAGEIGMFAIRSFPVARTLEESFEAAFEALGKMPPPPPKGATGTQTNPAIEQAKIAADVHDTQTRAQTSVVEAEAKTQQTAAELAQKQQESADQLQIERERMFAESQHNAAQLALEAEKMHSTERVASSRVAATDSRSAGRLV